MKTLSILLLLFFSVNSIESQSFTESKRVILESNNITTEVWNYGSIGSIGGFANLRWNGLKYISEFGIMISAEVVSAEGDTIHITSDSFLSGYSGDYNPSHSEKWGWLPVEGYSNPSSSEFANSVNLASWPEGWDFWPGEYGLGQIIAENEAYYFMNDYNNAEFSYFPSNTNPLMRGLGVSSEVRTYQFKGGLKDALLIKYFITNESDKFLQKVYFGFNANPSIGGSGDYNSDIVKIANIAYNNFTTQKNIVDNTIYLVDNAIYLGDNDTSIVESRPLPGYLSFKLLETPNNLDLTSFHAPKGNEYQPKDDDKMWEFFTTGVDTLNYLYNTPNDIEIFFGTGPFNLAPNETKIVKLGVFFSNDYEDFLRDATYIGLHHNWPQIEDEIDTRGGNENYQIQLNPMQNIINGEYNITWNYSGNVSNTKVFLEYSNNLSEDWYPLAVSIDAEGSFIWNTVDVDDGVNYMLRLVAYNETNPKEYYYDVSQYRFTINNPSFNAKPELDLITTFNDTLINSSPVTIQWISEDADNNELDITIEYAFDQDGPFNKINSDSYSNGDNYFIWDITKLPNAKNYFLKIIASDGTKDSTLSSNPFTIEIFENTLTSSHIKNYHGNATPIIQIQTIDQSKLKNDEYSILFHVNESNKMFDVKNLSTNEMLLQNYPVNEFVSTPLIEGMKIIIKDSGNDIDYEKSRFINNSLTNFNFSITYPALVGEDIGKVDDDYVFIFNDPDTLADGSWVYPDTMQTFLGLILAPFSIWNIRGNAPNFNFKEQATFVILELNNDKRDNGQWDFGEQIIIQPQGTTDPKTSYQISFNIENKILPRSGDSLYLITFNQIEENDEFRFSPDSNLIVKVENEILEYKYQLSNNYPNPFNPKSTIQFSIPKQSLVNLTIYDVLGREIQVLVDEQKLPGSYEIEFDASSLSSGIYFYRLYTKNFIETKKMILLK